MRLRSIAILTTVVAVGCASAPRRIVAEPSWERPRGESPTREERDIARALAGEWRLANRDGEERIDAAVARVTDQMGFLISGIANGRLDQALNPDRRVVVEPDGEHVTLAIGEGRPFRVTLDGRAVTRQVDGRAVTTRARLRGGRLMIEERTDQGTRVLALQPRGESLVVSTRVQSEQLPEDIVYRMSYRRS
jgi:hypothetical protein